MNAPFGSTNPMRSTTEEPSFPESVSELYEVGIAPVAAKGMTVNGIFQISIGEEEVHAYIFLLIPSMVRFVILPAAELSMTLFVTKVFAVIVY